MVDLALFPVTTSFLPGYIVNRTLNLSPWTTALYFSNPRHQMQRYSIPAILPEQTPLPSLTTTTRQLQRTGSTKSLSSIFPQSRKWDRLPVGKKSAKNTQGAFCSKAPIHVFHLLLLLAIIHWFVKKQYLSFKQSNSLY